MSPSLWAPYATTVDLLLAGGRQPLTRVDGGWWRGGPDLADGDRYAFSLDGDSVRRAMAMLPEDQRTVLSLFYVPVVFTYVDDMKQWIVRLFARRAPAPVPAAE